MRNSLIALFLVLFVVPALITRAYQDVLGELATTSMIPIRSFRMKKDKLPLSGMQTVGFRRSVDWPWKQVDN